MHRTTTGLVLVALMLNNKVQADEMIMRDNFFVANESRQQWINEQNGRTGTIVVSGALLSSPCTLETNEVMLPQPNQKAKTTARYMLKLKLQGCGDSAVSSTEKRDSIIVTANAEFAGKETGMLQPEVQMISHSHPVMYDGTNQLTYWLSETQQQALEEGQETARKKTKSSVNNLSLRLRIDYE